MPPPKSPDTSPMAAKRAWRPPASTADALMPAPHTTATPTPRSLPARSTAKVSFRSTTRDVQPAPTTRASRWRSSTGRSAPARQKPPALAKPRRSSSPARSQAASSVTAIAGTTRSMPSTSCEQVGPRAPASTLPSLPTSTASVFELPPSTPTAATGGLLNLRLVDGHEPCACLQEPLEDGGERPRGRLRPAVQQHDADARPAAERALDDVALDVGRVVLGVPVLRVHVPAVVAVAQLAQHAQHALVVCALAERAAEAWARIGRGHGDDRVLRVAHVAAKSLIGQDRHRRVVVRVVADEVPRVADAARDRRLREHPAALQEEG